MTRRMNDPMMNRIYLDHAATTPVSPRVLEAMLPFFTECWGNASAVYATGREARKAVEKARKQVAEAIGAHPQEILLTSGGTESDNLAIRGIAAALKDKGKHIITTAIEHHAVLNTCMSLGKDGYEVTCLQPDGAGRITPEALEGALREDTILVSVMTANNEIGTLQPVRELAAVAKAHGVLFHTDAVQAVGAVPVDVEETGVDLLSLSAHKFYGPKGAGALYIRKGTRIEPILTGGKQERGLRGGTENVPAIVGLGAAIEEAAAGVMEHAAAAAALRDELEARILAGVGGVRVNGAREARLPNNCSLTFENVDGEALLLRLDLAGIAASAGSACTSGSLESSHVLKAIGLNEEEARGTLRLTVGIDNTREEISRAADTVVSLVTELRNMYHKTER